MFALGSPHLLCHFRGGWRTLPIRGSGCLSVFAGVAAILLRLSKERFIADSGDMEVAALRTSLPSCEVNWRTHSPDCCSLAMVSPQWLECLLQVEQLQAHC